ncbi:MAG: calcium-binding protein [Planctomycetota bacterium]
MKHPLNMVLPLSAALSLFLSGSVHAQQTVSRISVSTLGAQGDAKSERPAVSLDGNFVAFQSNASTIIPGDLNFVSDVMVRDITTGSVELISVNTIGGFSNGPSERPAISSDGRYVAFASDASNLVVGDVNFTRDVFLRDRTLGTTTLISKSTLGIQGNGASTRPSISADGRYIVYRSASTNLLASFDLNSIIDDVFLYDTVTGVTELVSKDSLGIQGNNASDRPAISGDGNLIVFWSDATNLIAGDFNFARDVFLHNRTTGVTSLVSQSTAGVQGNGISSRPTISSDGTYIAYRSIASNLVAGDTNLFEDVFLCEVASGITTRVSVSSAGVQGNGLSSLPSLSTDGHLVAFRSLASNLSPADTNFAEDVFVHDTTTGITTNISGASGGAQGNGNSSRPSISGDGALVAYQSHATNLVAGDTNLVLDAFLWEDVPPPPPVNDTIVLAGPATGLAGSQVTFTWDGASSSSNYWFLYSFSNTGFVFSGHQFDLGGVITPLGVGSNTVAGTGSWTSPPLPPSMIGIPIYFEVAASPSPGVFEDSNFVNFTIL